MFFWWYLYLRRTWDKKINKSSWDLELCWAKPDELVQCSPHSSLKKQRRRNFWFTNKKEFWSIHTFTSRFIRYSNPAFLLLRPKMNSKMFNLGSGLKLFWSNHYHFCLQKLDNKFISTDTKGKKRSWEKNLVMMRDDDWKFS